MQFTKFGQTGLTVSRMILRTGTFGKQTDENEAHRMLDKAAEVGINFIDTADIYPPGAEAGGAGVEAMPPRAPRLVTVIVEPVSSSSFALPDRAVSLNRAISAANCQRSLRSACRTTGTSNPRSVCVAIPA